MRRIAGAFLAGVITALAVVLACNRLIPSHRALLGTFVAGAVLGMAAVLMCAAPWTEDKDE